MKKNVDRKKVGKTIKYGIVNSETTNKTPPPPKIFFNSRLLFVDSYPFVSVDTHMFFPVSSYDSITCHWTNI